jgi:hypothetical protein
MGKMRIQSLVPGISFLLIFSFSIFLCTTLFSAEKKKKPLKLDLEECQELIRGTWKIVETNTMGKDIGADIRYSFNSEQNKCCKKIDYNGYAEESIGDYVLEKKGKECTLVIKFENGTEETYTFYFETKDRLNLTTIADKTRLISILERVDENAP